jgi:hypothetical protein
VTAALQEMAARSRVVTGVHFQYQFSKLSHPIACAQYVEWSPAVARQRMMQPSSDRFLGPHVCQFIPDVNERRKLRLRFIAVGPLSKRLVGLADDDCKLLERQIVETSHTPCVDAARLVMNPFKGGR